MIDQVVQLIIDESKWLTASMGLALLSVAFLLRNPRHSALPIRRRIAAAMSLFFGITIGTMAFGHLLAVTTKLVMGTLEEPVPIFYAIGIVLAIPSWWLAYHARRVVSSDEAHGRVTVGLNAFLAIILLALGLHNLPLALPGFFTVGYHLHSARWVGWAIVGLAVVTNVGLFIASLIFLGSGQSFEQFRGY